MFRILNGNFIFLFIYHRPILDNACFPPKKKKIEQIYDHNENTHKSKVNKLMSNVTGSSKLPRDIHDTQILWKIETNQSYLMIRLHHEFSILLLTLH